MAVLALGLVGAGLGSFVGGAFGAAGVGAAIGWSLGTAIGGALFNKPATVQGPTLADLSLPPSQYGTPIAWILGTMAVKTTVLWQTDLIPVERTERVDAKGGGSQKIRHTDYYANFAVLVGKGPGRVIRIWLNDTLALDLSADNEGPPLGSDVGGGWAAQTPAPFSALIGGAPVRIYPGSADQLPDPLIQAIEGINRTPAYRHRIYIVFERLPVRNYGNSLPRVTVEVTSVGSDAFPTVTYDHDSGRPGDPSMDARPGIVFDPQSNLVVAVAGNYDDEPSWSDITAFDQTGSVRWTAQHSSPLASDRMYMTTHGGVLWLGTYTVKRIDIATGAATSFFAGDPARAVDAIAYCPQNNRLWLARQSPDRVELFDADVGVTELLRLDISNPHGIIWVPSAEEMWVYSNPGVMQRYDAGGTLQGTFAVSNYSTAVALVYDAVTDAVWASNGADSWRILVSDHAETHVATPGARSLAIDTLYSRALWIDTSRNLRAIALDDLSVTTLGTGVGSGSSGGRYHAFNPLQFSLWCTDGGNTFDSGYTRRVLLQRVAAGEVTLGQIVQTIAEAVDVTPAELDVSALTDIVPGALLSRRATARSFIDPLRAAYAFDLPERDGKLVAVKRGAAPVLTIPYEHLAAHEGDEAPPAIATRRELETALPAKVEIAYIDPSTGEPSVQRAPRAPRNTRSVSVMGLELSLALPADTVQAMAERVYAMAHIARNQHRLVVPRDYVRLDAADVVNVIDEDGAEHRVLITRSDFGHPGLIQLEVQDDEASIYTQIGAGALPPPREDEIAWLASAQLVLIDTALLSDAHDDAGFYAAVNGVSPAYPGATVFKAHDNANFGAVLDLLATPTGIATGALATGITTTWDEASTLTVQLDNPEQTLESSTDAAVLNGANGGLLRGPNGWEILQWVDAVHNGGGSYTLSRLLRGRRGTEYAVAGHVVGERFVALRNAVQRMPMELSERNIVRYYMAVTFGLPMGDSGQAFANSCIGLKPLSPVHIQGTRDESGNLTLTAVRRSRLGGGWQDFDQLPLGEEVEAYEIDIMDGASVVRVIHATTTTVEYSAADQTADFGAPQDPVTVRWHQMSATVGRGFPGVATV